MPDPSSIMVGGAAGLYRNTNGGADWWANPVWGEVLLARDVKPTGGWDFVEAPDRASPLKPYAKAQLDAPIQVMMRADVGDGEFNAWVTAAWSRIATLDLLVLNAKRTVINAAGFRGPYLVSIADEAQEIGGVIYTTFEIRPTIVRDQQGTLRRVVYAWNDDLTGLTYREATWAADPGAAGP